MRNDYNMQSNIIKIPNQSKEKSNVAKEIISINGTPYIDEIVLS